MGVSLAHESALWDAGSPLVAGIDEVGRGALAGPVSVGVCVVARCDAWPDGLADSKELRPAARERIAAELADFGVGRAVGHAEPGEIDQVGIVAALRLAAVRALDALAAEGIVPDAVLLDGTHDWLTAPAPDLFAEEVPAQAPPVTMVVKGDAQCVSIAAASVLAKVDRDARMRAAHDDYPAYGWDANKGYGAAGHVAALAAHGPTPWHRRSWKLPGVVAPTAPRDQS